jgi:hypothetical protein
MEFITPIFQSLLASAIYGGGGLIFSAIASRISLKKQYENAFEKAICRFYADSKYAGNEARRNYNEYLKMLMDASKQTDILSSNNHIYAKLLDLFTQEVSKDKRLRYYTYLKNLFTTQKKLDDISKEIQQVIDDARTHREEIRSEHGQILDKINVLENLITDPLMRNITLAPVFGSAAYQNGEDGHITNREGLVEKCIASIDRGKLLIIYGALKVGKTTLAQLVAKRYKNVTIIENVATDKLETIVLKHIGDNNANDKIIITSSSALHKSLSTIDFSMIEQIEVPLLNITETIDLINTYHPTSDYSTFIFGHTNGHPVLIKALCSYLSSCNWKFDTECFGKILNYSFDHNLTRALSDIINRLVSDNDTRALLNRLILINGSFTEAEVQLLANNTPQIEETRRRLYSLIPTWITVNDGTFIISPLIKKTWHADISKECQILCYKGLAHNILKLGKPLTESDILNYIIYSINAEEYDNAGHLYIMALNKLHDKNIKLPTKSLLRSLWIDLPLPIEMSLRIKIGVRITQLLFLGDVPQKHRNYLLWDLKQLVDDYRDPDLKELFYSTISLLCLQENEITDGLKYYTLYKGINRDANTITTQHAEVSTLFDNNIWIFLLRLQSVKEYETWLDTFQSLNLEYSHDDKDICNYCYLSIHHLITSYLNEYDTDAKLLALNRIKDKAEQCNCQEIAIACLYKVLDIYTISNRYDDAITLYKSQYLKFNNYPLAIILLNGIIAYIYYRTNNEEDRMLYFKQVIEYPNQEIAPDIQLHTREIWSYIIAKSDPKSSITIIEDALEYASNENRRLNIFTYYQCKGELSFVYWCAGEYSRALEILSECVDFVLPLAEAEKNFAKTYLCLCNCLITKYCFDIQCKPLPLDQASPKHGMFTENNLTGLDDLYTPERLYVTCYQMFDLCDKLNNKTLAYKWAKNTVNNSKRKEPIGSHYLLFTLLPMFSIEEDFDDIEFIIRCSDLSRRLIYQIEPQRLHPGNDLAFIEYQIIPLLMLSLVLDIRGSKKGIELVISIIRDYVATSDIDAITIIKAIFERDTFDRQLITEINTLDVQKHFGAYLCAYILTAHYSDNDYAFDLLISIMPELQKHLVQIYGTKINIIISHFISTFWKARIINTPKEFSEYDRLKEKGLMLIDEYEGKINQSNKTMMIISNHLKLQHKLNSIQNDWLNS